MKVWKHIEDDSPCCRLPTPFNCQDYSLRSVIVDLGWNCHFDCHNKCEHFRVSSLIITGKNKFHVSSLASLFYVILLPHLLCVGAGSDVLYLSSNFAELRHSRTKIGCHHAKRSPMGSKQTISLNGERKIPAT